MKNVRAASQLIWARLMDAFVVAVSFLAVAFVREQLHEVWKVDLLPGPQPVFAPVTLESQLHLIVAIVPLWLVSLSVNATYTELRRVRPDVLFIRVTRAVAFALAALLGLLFVYPPATPTSRTFLLGFAITSIFALFAARRAWMKRAEREAPDTNILVVGSTLEAAPLVETVLYHPQWGVRVAGVIRPDDEEVTSVRGVKVLGTLSQLPRVIADHNIAQVIMTGRAWDTATLRYVADICEEVGVTFSMDANFLGLSIARAEVMDLGGWSILSFSSTPANAEALVVKRMIDVLGASIALALSAPVMALIALCIKLEDGGPVFFTQERSGLYGRTFPMYKFRSMVVDAERLRAQLEAQNEMGGPVFKMKRDPRITRVGALIRKLSLDEFPQFWNVLRGEMSLVGPRPPLPSEVARYERWQMRRLSMRPGLTCIWQVRGRNRIDFDQWMRLDLEYIDNWSLFLDVKLLLRTVPAVLLGSGAR